LEMPPLRQRGDDIILLAERFLTLASADYGRPPARLDAAARAKLLAHHWPGNVRELGNVMERVALLSDAPIITADALALDPGLAPAAGRAPHTPDAAPRAHGWEHLGPRPLPAHSPQYRAAEKGEVRAPRRSQRALPPPRLSAARRSRDP